MEAAAIGRPFVAGVVSVVRTFGKGEGSMTGWMKKGPPHDECGGPF